MKEFWNERYSAEAYAYGEAPNQFFKQELVTLPPGKLLLPAEGEGRNAVYAAQSGWEVHAFDLSEAGKQKAEQLAARKNVSIDYTVGAMGEIDLPENTYDAIGLIYAHFPPDLKVPYYQQLGACLKQGGYIILEAFSKSQLQFNSINPKAGGPKNIDMLFSKEEIKSAFPAFEVLQLQEVEVDLQEGLYHSGKGSVIRFVGKRL